MTTPTGKPFTVTQLTAEIKKRLESVGQVLVAGELSNVRAPSSNGHLYFTIKDAGAQIDAVLFAGSLRTLSFRPKDGDKVEAYGDISLYAPRGRYQIVVRKMTPVGQGDLMARFEELKRRLSGEGLFAEEHKRTLPFLPRHIGIVTAPTGAAIRDMLNILSRRFPNLDILIAPARVQGAGAAEEIAQGVRDLNEAGNPAGRILPGYPRRDVIIVGRGGGSLEDLWAFNEEVVARAVYESAIPVISAVGHEIDFSICDFAADKRAPTPSAAAELAVPRKGDLEEQIGVLSGRLARALDHTLSDRRGRLAAAAGHRVFAEPAHAVERHAQHVDILSARAGNAVAARLAEAQRRFAEAFSALELQRTRRFPELRNRLSSLSDRAARAVERTFEARKGAVAAADRQLAALSPVAVLERGYSITLLDDGRALRDPAEAPAGTRLTTRLAGDKTVVSHVDGAKPPKRRKAKEPEDGAAEQGQLDLFA